MEPNNEAFEGPTASIWIDFHNVKFHQMIVQLNEEL
jgi:hypothetical protein